MAASARTLEARRLHEQGWGYKRIGRHFGVSRDTARDWVNPTRRKRIQARYLHRGPPCPSCGGPRNRTSEGSCDCCLAVRAFNRRQEIQALYLAGEPGGVIAAAIGTTPRSLAVELNRMRAAGWNLPYRYAMAVVKGRLRRVGATTVR